MMISNKSEIVIMITTILTMMVLQSYMLAWGWNMMTRKTASRWLILFSPAYFRRQRMRGLGEACHTRVAWNLWMFIRNILRPCFNKSEHMYKNNMEEKAQMAVYLSCPATNSSYMSSNMGGTNCKFCLAFLGDDLLWPSLVSNICHPSMQQSYATKYAPRTCVKMNQVEGIAKQGYCLWSWHKKMNNSQSVLP